MRSRIISVGPAVLAALAFAPTPAMAQDVCAVLGRIEAAAHEATPFASLAAPAAEEAIFPGFQEGSCTTERRGRFICYRNIAPASLDIAALGPVVQACLGVAPVPSPVVNSGYQERGLIFTVRGLRYRLDNMCDQSCRAGLIASIEVSFVRDEP